MMFNASKNYIGAQESSCRPDPEMMLQRARARKEELEFALNGLRCASTVHIYLPETSSTYGLTLIGGVVSQIWEIEREIESILKEIDREA